MNAPSYLDAMLARRLDAPAATWLDGARREIRGGADLARSCALFSLASRFAPRRALAPDASELAQAARILAGWNPERWSVLEAVRVALVLSRPDLAQPGGAAAVEELFRYADAGELCAAYRSLALLPLPERFVWRAGEGARSNLRTVFEAACCDTPYPAQHFDAVAFRSAAIKCLFVEAPLWRVQGLDARLDEELARMALDLAEERRSAGRAVNPQTWACLGAFGGERALQSLERELASGPPEGRAAAALGLARAGRRERLLSLASVEKDPLVHDVMSAALGGETTQAAFGRLDPSRQGAR
jgi:hypothetical protein